MEKEKYSKDFAFLDSEDDFNFDIYRNNVTNTAVDL